MNDVINNRVEYVVDALGGGGGGGTWGSITGTLSNQTDLQNALNLKYDASNPAGYITSSALSGYTPTSRTIKLLWLNSPPSPSPKTLCAILGRPSIIKI